MHNSNIVSISTLLCSVLVHVPKCCIGRPKCTRAIVSVTIQMNTVMKLFKTFNNDVIQDCCNFLNFSLPSDLLATRYSTFSNRYTLYKNLHWYFGLK